MKDNIKYKSNQVITMIQLAFISLGVSLFTKGGFCK